MVQIGIDLSMNSTGLVFVIPQQDKDDIVKFFQICPYVQKYSGSIQLLVYERDYNKDNYSYEDLAKITSATSLAKKIHEQITKMSALYKFTDCEVRMEGSIMSGGFKSQQARVNDLTVFNCITKMMLMKHPLISKITVVAPTTLKKWATGKGNAKKGAIVAKFLEMFPTFDITGKIDDIADAYFLACTEITKPISYVK